MILVPQVAQARVILLMYTTICRRTRIINVHKKIWRERTGSFHASAGGVRSIPNFNRRNTNKRWSRRPERRGSMLDRGVVVLIGYTVKNTEIIVCVYVKMMSGSDRPDIYVMLGDLAEVVIK